MKEDTPDVAFVRRVDRVQRRNGAVGFPIAVIYKYFDDSGPYLAAVIAYYAFVAVLPLLLLLTTVLGLVLAHNPALQHRIESSTVSQFPLVGEVVGHPTALGGGALGIIVGLVGSLYGGLGVAQATQYAANTAWAVPRNDRPNPFRARGRSLLLLATAGAGLLGTTILSALTASSVGSFGGVLTAAVVLASVLISAVAFVFVFRTASACVLTVREVAPGAVAAAVAWQLLQTFGAIYVGRVVDSSSTTNSVFGLVLGLLAFLYLTSVVVVICIEVNVVRVKHLYPRALLTPFTDNVELTRGDRRAYTGQAEAQRAKGFQAIDVTFHPDGGAADADPDPERRDSAP
ncbi:MAG: YihY/virulence factor BrkB family protein [Actinomycetota bacterium]|nr:YihY/virulence factor BrkB family protein [Actinomycetota bacterium]